MTNYVPGYRPENELATVDYWPEARELLAHDISCYADELHELGDHFGEHASDNAVSIVLGMDRPPKDGVCMCVADRVFEIQYQRS